MDSVVILSGGLDSTVLLANLSKRREVTALTLDYGQRHKVEIHAARSVARNLNVQHEIVDVSGLRVLLKGSSQTDSRVAVPHGHYAEESMKLTVVPNRNMILLSIAVAYAISLKANSVAYAAHCGDHAIYPDCRSEFVEALSAAVKLADWHSVQLEHPFTKMTKADIVRLGDKIGAPMHLTYSCYEGVEGLHCGKCGTCFERKQAFREAGVIDPTKYADYK